MTNFEDFELYPNINEEPSKGLKKVVTRSDLFRKITHTIISYINIMPYIVSENLGKLIFKWFSLIGMQTV